MRRTAGLLILFLVTVSPAVMAQFLGLAGVGNNGGGMLTADVINMTDCDNDGDGLTTTIAGNCHAGQALTWSILTPGTSPMPNWAIEDAPCGGVAAPTDLPRSVIVAGTTYLSKSTTKTWQRDLGDTTTNSLQGNFNTGGTIGVASYWMCTDAFANTGSDTNNSIFQFTTNNAGSGVLSQIHNASGILTEGFRLHVGSSGVPGNQINVGLAGNNVWYRTYQWGDLTTGQGVGSMTMKTTAGVELTGSPSTGVTLVTGSTVRNFIYKDGDTANAGKHAWITGVVICYTGACANATSSNYMNLVP